MTKRKISKATAAAKRKSRHSGRVVEDEQGNWLQVAQYVNWDKQGQAIDHEFGNLVRRKNNNDSLS